jgi:hypothetical protein
VSEDHDWVRRLLAEEGQADEPMPADVADRLDLVLDEQASQEVPAVEGHADQRVLPMNRRRQRRWGVALLAAAAVTVGGYSLTATGVLDGFAGDAASESTSADSADSGRDSAGGATDDRQESEVAPDSGAGSADGNARVDRRLLATGAADLSSQTLRRDAARLVAADARGTRPLAGRGDSPAASAQEPAGCVPPPTGLRGTRLAVTYDGQPATALLRPVRGDSTEVTVWDCASPSRLARVTVSAR